ncbi:hypothetical protein [Enterobacter bugandensis]|nr:hypothetical protein [Enterobacter bugandensis]
MCGIPTSVSATTHERRNLCGGLEYVLKGKSHDNYPFSVLCTF